MTVARAAELAGVHPAHFRRLCRRGVFPKPKRTAKGKPFFDYGLLMTVANVMKAGTGLNGEEIVFRQHPTRHVQTGHPQASQPDPLITDLTAALRKLGAPEKELKPQALKDRLRAAFGPSLPDFNTAITALARQLFPIQ